MTREEYLSICKKCSKRKLDLKRGLVCSLTDEFPEYTGKCADFTMDEKIIEKLKDEIIEESLANSGVKEIVIGLLILIAGIAASYYSGRVLFYGAIAIGLGKTISGIYLYTR